MLIAAAAAMFAACQQEDVVNDQSSNNNVQQAIGFSTFTPNVTRGAENSDATFKQGLENYHPDFYVWGFKNINGTYKSVFTGNDVYDEATKPDAVGADKSIVNWDDPDWTYAPVRYWDKSATNYNFFAVAPAKPYDGTTKWVGTTKLTDANPTAATPADAVVTFSIADYAVTGKSLAQSSTITNGNKAEDDKKGLGDEGYAVFGESTAKNEDLMISTDVKEFKTYGNKVAFEFNHILSRLNIAVKTTLETKYAQKEDANGPVFASTENDKTIYWDATAGKYYYLDSSDKVYSDATSGGFDLSTVSKVDDTDKPISGVVKLTEVKVYNLKANGSFDEATTVTNLAAGTAARWKDVVSPATVSKAAFGVAFSNTSTPANSTKTIDALVGTPYYGSNNTTDKATNIVEKDVYNFIYQGLVIPQTAKYAPCELDGSDLTTTGTEDAPYLKIVYTVDGESFTAYYNLASIFANSNLFVHPFFGNAYKIEGGDYAYYKDSKCYDSNGNLLSPDPSWELDASGNKIPMTVAEVNAIYSAESADLVFCEGWMNNLYITINPLAIEFDADVYEWREKNAGDVTIQ